MLTVAPSVIWPMLTVAPSVRMKLFADDTSLFSTVYEPNISASQQESDLKKILIGYTNGK